MRNSNRVTDRIDTSPDFVQSEEFQPCDWSHIFISSSDLQIVKEAMDMMYANVIFHKLAKMPKMHVLKIFSHIGCEQDRQVLCNELFLYAQSCK